MEKMEKQIGTGTKITFKETGKKYLLTRDETGFLFKLIELSKKIEPEHYSFQEFIDLYEAGEIAIEGFEETDAALVKSIVTNYIYNNNLKSQLSEVDKLKADIEQLKVENTQLTSANETLMGANEQLTTDNGQLTTRNNQLEEENKTLTAKNDQLNVAIEAMEEKTETE